jgi:hypothetical protein
LFFVEQLPAVKNVIEVIESDAGIATKSDLTSESVPAYAAR